MAANNVTTPPASKPRRSRAARAAEPEVVLLATGDRKIAVIRVLQKHLGTPLNEAKKLAESAPVTLPTSSNAVEGWAGRLMVSRGNRLSLLEFRKALEEAGAEIEIKNAAAAARAVADPLPELKRRVEAMGLRLLEEDPDAWGEANMEPMYYVQDPATTLLHAVRIGVDQLASWLDEPRTRRRDRCGVLATSAKPNGTSDARKGDDERDEDGIAPDGSARLDMGGDPDESDRHRYTVLYNPHIRSYDAINGIKGLAHALYEEHYDKLPENVQLLSHALRILADQLWTAACDVPYGIEKRVRAAMERPDTDYEAMEKRLVGTGHVLWRHPTNGTYALSDGQGRLRMSTASIDEIEGWLEREGIVTKGGAS